MSKHQYNSLRQLSKEKGFSIYSSYDSIKTVKKECYPPEENIVITETSAEVELQSLLECTIKRLVKLQEDVISHAINNTGLSLENVDMIYKWGFDGSSGQRQYKQMFSGGKSEDISDSDLLMTSLVPIVMYGYHKTKSEEKIVLWQNPRMSSTRYCRPIHFQFKKETTENTKNEVQYIQSKIDNLHATRIVVSGVEFSVNHKMNLTMVDGKVCNALTDTSSQVCYICGATPKTMNNLSELGGKSCDISTYSFGLSTLHAYIRFFECLLHISYKLDVKKWQARGDEEKKKVKARKETIIKRFQDEMGLIVDQPQLGTGSSNDGNTARTFFNNPEKSADITGINIDLIKRFSVILRALSSGFEINVKAFEKYTKETAKLYIELYSWFYMPVSVHKILIHGADVIKSFIIPIGQLAEDAQEARNKDYRFYRLHHTRKLSREKTNEDLLKVLLISSDPLISGMRPLPKKKLDSYSAEVIALLKCPDIGTSIEREIASVSCDSDSSD